jgi:hypothetical protein
VADPELHSAIFPASSAAASSFSDAGKAAAVAAATAAAAAAKTERRRKSAASSSSGSSGGGSQPDIGVKDGSRGNGGEGAALSDVNERETTPDGVGGGAGDKTDGDNNTDDAKEAAAAEDVDGEAADAAAAAADDNGLDDDDDDGFVMLSVADFGEMEHIAGCHFAVSWLLTWFAHSLNKLEDVARLFDLFLASDPLMPLYVGGAAVVADRRELLRLARGEVGGKCRREGANPRDSWPIIEGMLHMRMSGLPALLAEEEEEEEEGAGGGGGGGDTSSHVGVELKVVTEDGDDGLEGVLRVQLVIGGDGLRTAEQSDGENGGDSQPRVGSSGGDPHHRGDSRPRQLPPGWGVDAVVQSALKLHARIPPSSLYTILGVRPEPEGAFAAYPYPWLMTGEAVSGSAGEGEVSAMNDGNGASGGASRGGVGGDIKGEGEGEREREGEEEGEVGGHAEVDQGQDHDRRPPDRGCADDGLFLMEGCSTTTLPDGGDCYQGTVSQVGAIQVDSSCDP